jgi:hypothetical protein
LAAAAKVLGEAMAVVVEDVGVVVVVTVEVGVFTVVVVVFVGTGVGIGVAAATGGGVGAGAGIAVEGKSGVTVTAPSDGMASVNITRLEGYVPLIWFQIPSQVIRFKWASPSFEVNTVVASASLLNNWIFRI